MNHRVRALAERCAALQGNLHGVTCWWQARWTLRSVRAGGRSAHSGAQWPRNELPARPAQALRYAKAAAIVRACAYRLTPDVRGGDLPFVGDVTGRHSVMLPCRAPAIPTVVQQCCMRRRNSSAVHCRASRAGRRCCMAPPAPPPTQLPSPCRLAACSPADRRHHPDRQLPRPGLLQVGRAGGRMPASAVLSHACCRPARVRCALACQFGDTCTSVLCTPLHTTLAV